jgi:predicted GNAT family acetyltransferase
MNEFPLNLGANPVWHALHSRHRRFALSAGEACRYPADVAPFAAVAEPSALAMQQLHSLLAPAESVWLIGQDRVTAPGLSIEETLECLQMVVRDDFVFADTTPAIVRLKNTDASTMLALTTLAFPGFFRRRTHEMGTYLGVWSHGELVAMGGERLMLDGYPEISGICTHPAHRGKGLAASIISRLVRNHRRDGLVSWLQVAVKNNRAVELYSRLGFEMVRRVTLHRFARTD